MIPPVAPISVGKRLFSLNRWDALAVLLVVGMIVFLAQTSRGLLQPLASLQATPLSLDPAHLPAYFSFYQSLRTVPAELLEVSQNFRFSPWMRFWRVEVPFAMPQLIWNMMMSMSGGWFFVVAAEAISVGDTTVKLPGIGSYIALAIEVQDLAAVDHQPSDSVTRTRPPRAFPWHGDRDDPAPRLDQPPLRADRGACPAALQWRG
jgi:ABC-type proline/glycine betaine transport system permease subunit